jgi:hypothetical protein
MSQGTISGHRPPQALIYEKTALRLTLVTSSSLHLEDCGCCCSRVGGFAMGLQFGCPTIAELRLATHGNQKPPPFPSCPIFFFVTQLIFYLQILQLNTPLKCSHASIQHSIAVCSQSPSHDLALNFAHA